MIAKPKTEGKEGGFKMMYVFYVLVGIAITLGVYYAFESGQNEGSLVALGLGFGKNTCGVASYRTVKVTGVQGAAPLTMFVYGTYDEVSDLVVNSGPGKNALPDSHFYDFYSDYLCNNTNGSVECGGLALDVGAHLGTHTLFLAQLGFQVHSFEPFRPTAELLRCSVDANRLDVLVVAEGVSNETTNECLFFPMHSHSQKSMFVPKGMGLCADTNQSIPVVSLDHYWEAVLEKKPIHFIRVDVTGHEALVLQGAKKLLKEAPPTFVLMNYNPSVLTLKNVGRDDLTKAIFGAKYRIYDCGMKVEIKSNYQGDSILDEYKDISKSTNLLLVQSHMFTGDLPDFRCGA